MIKFASLANLQRFANNLKAYFVKKENGKGLSTNDFSNADKNKLDGLYNTQVIKASNETEAKNLSQNNPNNIYYW